MNEVEEVMKLLGPNGEGWVKGNNFISQDSPESNIEGRDEYCMYGAMGTVFNTALNQGGTNLELRAAELMLDNRGQLVRDVITLAALYTFGGRAGEYNYNTTPTPMADRVQNWQDSFHIEWWHIRAVLIRARDMLKAKDGE